MNNIELEKAKVLTALAEYRNNALQTGNTKLVEYFNTLLTTAASGGLLIKCSDFVKAFNEQHKVNISPNGIYSDGDLIRNHKAFFYRLHESWKDYKAANSIKESFSRDSVALEFEAILEDHWDQKRKDLRAELEPIKDPEEFDKQLDIFCTAVFGKRHPDKKSVEYRRQKAFVGHFLWQTQMKLHYGAKSVLRQGNESMLMFISTSQKTGKSTTIRRLIEPYTASGFVWRTDFNRLEDPFSMQNLAYNYVAFFDDMSRSSVRNMGRFKQIVTDDEVHFRGMYTQTEHRMPKLATLIGTSNKTARELMHDTTGLRRFHEVYVNGNSVDTGDGIDLDTLADFDHKTLIRLVPVGPTASPLYRYISEKELTAYEESIRPKHVVELWKEDQDLEFADKDTGRVEGREELYADFCNWSAKNGYSGKFVPNAESFSNKLLELGAIRGRTSKFRGFYIKNGGDTQ